MKLNRAFMNKFSEQREFIFNGKCGVISSEMLMSLGSVSNKAKTSGVENARGRKFTQWK